MPVLRHAAAQARAEDRAPGRPRRHRPSAVRACGFPSAAARARSPSRARASAESPRLGRLRAGEIPGIRGDEHGRPYATFVLVALSFGLWLSLAFYVRADFALTAIGGDPWRFVTASLLNDGTAAQFAAIVGLGVFGWLIERRQGAIAVVALFLLCGPGALAAAVAIDPGAVVFGTHGAALGLLCAWAVPALLERRRNPGDDDNDLLGVAVIAAVLLLVPFLSQGSALAGIIGGGLRRARGPRARDPEARASMTRETYSAEEVDAAVAALSDPDRFGHAQEIVTHAAPSLQRVLGAALEQGGWFDQAHEAQLTQAAETEDSRQRAQAIQTLVEEETRLGMLVGVSVGFELARELAAAAQRQPGEELR